MDFSKAAGATFRDMGETMRDGLPVPSGSYTIPEGGLPVRVLKGSRTYPDMEIDDLWDAMTNSERIPRWLLPVTGDLKLGGRYQLEGNAGGHITRCDAPTALDVTWEYGASLSWVNVRLATEADGVLLTLEHIMPKVDAAEAHWQQYGPGAAGVGWDLSFWGLDMHLTAADGEFDKDAVMVWMGSEEGMAFMRACASAWGEAHIASGESPDVARSMAEQTAKFYTGS